MSDDVEFIQICKNMKGKVTNEDENIFCEFNNEMIAYSPKNEMMAITSDKAKHGINFGTIPYYWKIIE